MRHRPQERQRILHTEPHIHQNLHRLCQHLGDLRLLRIRQRKQTLPLHHVLRRRLRQHARPHQPVDERPQDERLRMLLPPRLHDRRPVRLILAARQLAPLAAQQDALGNARGARNQGDDRLEQPLRVHHIAAQVARRHPPCQQETAQSVLHLLHLRQHRRLVRLRQLILRLHVQHEALAHQLPRRLGAASDHLFQVVQPVVHHLQPWRPVHIVEAVLRHVDHPRPVHPLPPPQVVQRDLVDIRQPEASTRHVLVERLDRHIPLRKRTQIEHVLRPAHAPLRDRLHRLTRPGEPDQQHAEAPDAPHPVHVGQVPPHALLRD